MLKKQIQGDVTDALKQGNQETAGVLRLILAAMTTKEKEKRYKVSKQKPSLKESELVKESELTDQEIIDVLSSEIKKRKDAIGLYEKGNRKDLADKEKNEIEILKKYLPEQLSTEELKKLVEESIKKVGGPKGHPEIKDMGKVMTELMPKVKYKADISEVSKMAKELLGK